MEPKEPNANKLSDFEHKSQDNRKEEEIPDKPKKRTRKWKDPDAPKRPLGAYFFYFKENNARIRELNSECNQKMIVSKVAQQWKQLTGEQKKPYEDLSKADKQRYIREKEAYEVRLAKAAEDAKEETKGNHKNDNKFSSRRKDQPNDYNQNKRQKTEETYSPRNEKEVRLKDVLGSDQVSFASESEYLAAYSPPLQSLHDPSEVQETRRNDQRIVKEEHDPRIIYEENYPNKNQALFKNEN